jgi:hypothetical protein
MAALEQSGTVNDDDQVALAPPPPPPPPGKGRSTLAPAPARPVQPVKEPWVPKSLSFFDVHKPMHRMALMACFGLLCLIGIGWAVFCFHNEQKDKHFNEVALHANGHLIGKAVRNDIRRRRSLPREAYDITYSFPVDGRSWTGVAKQVEVDDLPDGADPSHAFDSQHVSVDVLYDPEDPAENRLEPASVAADWMFMAIGVGAFGIGAFGGWRVFRYDRYARSIGS